MGVEVLYGAIVGGVVSLVFGILMYWITDGFAARKDQVKDTKDDFSKALEKSEENIAHVYEELKKIYDSLYEHKDMSTKLHISSKDHLHDIEKDIMTKITSLSTSVELLMNSIQINQKDTGKLEGKIEEIIKFQNEYRGEMKMNSAKFDRIFAYIDSRPRMASDAKNVIHNL